jgi:hypothetical protein
MPVAIYIMLKHEATLKRGTSQLQVAKSQLQLNKDQKLKIKFGGKRKSC